MLLTSTCALLIAGTATSVKAGSTGAAAEAQIAPEQEHEEIIVIAPPLFRDVRPERTLDRTAIESYGISTVDELLAEIQAELDADEDAVLVVNGERIYDVDDIGAYPVEVIRQLQVFPRGSGVRVGGLPGQRVISMTLHRQMRSATVTVAPRLATEGDWSSARGETLLTYVRGQTRANVALRARDESALLESQRDIIQPEPRLPFAIGGNVIAYPDLSGEIDPLLSDAGGRVITVAPVPASASPALADFASRQPNSTDLGRFRTLRPSTRAYDFNANLATRLTPWLTSTATLRLGHSTSRSLLGLPSGLFALGPDNAFSPFSTTVALAFLGEDPLHQRSRRESGEANVTLNARFGRWRASLNGRHAAARTDLRIERQDRIGPVLLDDTVDPFGSGLGGLILIRTNRAVSDTRATTALLNLTGPAITLPAGDLQITVEGRLGWQSIRTRSDFSGADLPRKLSRNEQAIRGAFELPIASRRAGFLPELGELSATAEFGRIHFSDAGTLRRHALGLTWEPISALRLRGAIESARTPASIDILGEPIVVTPDVRVFDPLTGETVDVVQISGGNPFLLPERVDTKRLSALVRLVPSLGLQLNAEYSDLDRRNFASNLPLTSLPVMLAFPDRFIRNDDGVLTQIDLRPVNFAGERQKRLRYGLSLNAPLGTAGLAKVDPVAADPGETGDQTDEPPLPTGPRTRLMVTANHTLLLSNKIEIRPGLPPVDLLDGGAIGIGGGRLRHQLDATAAVTRGGTGARLGLIWRGASRLETRIGGTPELVRFSPLLLLNLRAFADAKRVFPSSSWASGTRFSLNVVNLTNQRQRVRDPFGQTPLQYQPGYRDPIGRTIEFEIRKVF